MKLITVVNDAQEVAGDTRATPLSASIPGVTMCVSILSSRSAALRISVTASSLLPCASSVYEPIGLNASILT